MLRLGLIVAKEIPSVTDLRRKSEVVAEEIKAATAAYAADESAEPLTFKCGYGISVTKAIEMHPHARTLLADATRPPALHRAMVKCTVIFGFPVQE